MSIKKCFGITLLSAILSTGSLVSVAAASSALQRGHEYLAIVGYPNTLTVVDASTDEIFKTCSMPDAFNPGTVTISPDKSHAYVLNNRYGDLYGVELDTCKVVFHADLSDRPGERVKSMFSIAVSPDGKEVYSVVNPTKLNRDTYEVQTPRLQVYSTSGGMDAKPIRTFPVPRQLGVMFAADDGSLYIAGADIYRMDVKSGKLDVAVAVRNWKRPLYGQPDVLNVWPQQLPQHSFDSIYTADRFKDEKKAPGTNETMYGYIDVDLATGKASLKDFAPVTEVFFSGVRSPTNPDIVYVVGNRLAKFDSKTEKLVGEAPLDHTYYVLTLNKSGNKVYVAGAANSISVFDAATMKKIKEIRLSGDTAQATPQIFVR
ncbi:quinohemoprotein amine dehydrogenase subunit beta [Paraburkholderia guartelaensis]|uniref:quinohemoprotein amine dehydrogenase subunit beta n=1 Tax=Paraburkholderia guartelaensis TaxID=2546446 RepID=UPI002AB662DA|nr:quinohemoprotein amine dehydrogenase subunit beta [Paraburkholderia guartelaensis]